jgi:hypothetical protein
MTGQFNATRPSRGITLQLNHSRLSDGQQHRTLGHLWTQLGPHFRLRRTFDPCAYLRCHVMLNERCAADWVLSAGMEALSP